MFFFACLEDFGETKKGSPSYVYLQKPVVQIITQEKSCQHSVELKPLKTDWFLYILECEDRDDW